MGIEFLKFTATRVDNYPEEMLYYCYETIELF